MAGSIFARVGAKSGEGVVYTVATVAVVCCAVKRSGREAEETMAILCWGDRRVHSGDDDARAEARKVKLAD